MRTTGYYFLRRRERQQLRRLEGDCFIKSSARRRSVSLGSFHVSPDGASRDLIFFMEKRKKGLVSAEFIAGATRGVLVAMLFGSSLLVCAALSGCNMLSGVPLESMTVEQIEVEKAKAQETIALGQTIAESVEFLPFPLNLIAVAGSGALIILGGKKAAKLTGAAAKLTGAAAKKIIVPALAATAGKILKKKTEPEACNCAQDTPEKTEAPEGAQNQ